MTDRMEEEPGCVEELAEQKGPTDQGDFHGLEGEAAGLWDGDGDSADRGDDGASEDDGKAEGKEKSGGAKGWESESAFLSRSPH